MKAWQSTLKYRTKLKFTCMYIITLSLTSSKQVLLIRFFYTFCDFFHGRRLYNFSVHFKNYIFTKWSHYLYLQYSKFWRWLKATLSNVKKSFFNQIKILITCYLWMTHYFHVESLLWYELQRFPSTFPKHFHLLLIYSLISLLSSLDYSYPYLKSWGLFDFKVLDRCSISKHKHLLKLFRPEIYLSSLFMAQFCVLIQKREYSIF